MFGVLFYIFSVNTFLDGIYLNPITKMWRKIKEITLLEVLLALSGGVFNLTMVREITLYDLALCFHSFQ